MKAKDLITELSKLNPESEIYVHVFDTYTITKNFKVENAFRDSEEIGDPICFVDKLDEDFTVPVILLTNREDEDCESESLIPEEKGCESDIMNAYFDSQLDDRLL